MALVNLELEILRWKKATKPPTGHQHRKTTTRRLRRMLLFRFCQTRSHSRYPQRINLAPDYLRWNRIRVVGVLHWKPQTLQKARQIMRIKLRQVQKVLLIKQTRMLQVLYQRPKIQSRVPQNSSTNLLHLLLCLEVHGVIHNRHGKMVSIFGNELM